MQQTTFTQFEHAAHSMLDASSHQSESSDDEDLVVFLEKGHQKYKECTSTATTKRR